jgi:hypothetical protein
VFTLFGATAVESRIRGDAGWVQGHAHSLGAVFERHVRTVDDLGVRVVRSR